MGGGVAPDASAFALGLFIAGCVGMVAGGLAGFAIGYGRGFQECWNKCKAESDRLAERLGRD